MKKRKGTKSLSEPNSRTAKARPAAKVPAPVEQPAPEEPEKMIPVTLYEDWFSPSLQLLVDQIMKAAPADLRSDRDNSTGKILERLSCPPGMTLAVWRSLSPEQQAPFRKARGAWLKKENKRYEAKEKAAIEAGASALKEYVHVLRRLHDVIGKELSRAQDPKGSYDFLFALGRTPGGNWYEMPWPAIIRDVLPEYAKVLKDIVAKQEKCIALRTGKCFNCGNPLPRELARGKRRFCSLECSGATRAKRFRQKSATRKTLNEKQKR